jgi:hypothetical protein
MPKTFYKFLTEDGLGPYSDYRWPLPKNGKPGAWVTARGPLKACANGVHFCSENAIVMWINTQLYTAEIGSGKKFHDLNKTVARKGRLLRRVETWNERTARLFACDCAEHVAHLASDPTLLRRAIEVARQCANGKASVSDMIAAWDAAWAAPRAAAWDAAWNAPRAAAWAAAGDAARAAAWNAPRDAAWDAARAAARAAAGAAARDAARSAAWAAAWAAAGDAAWDSARAAARAAAGAAERAWQNQRLMQYLRGEVG